MISFVRRRFAPIVLLVTGLAQWAILFPATNPTWDAAFYYGYARSVVFDGDLHIANSRKPSVAAECDR